MLFETTYATTHGMNRLIGGGGGAARSRAGRRIRARRAGHGRAESAPAVPGTCPGPARAAQGRARALELLRRGEASAKEFPFAMCHHARKLSDTCKVPILLVRRLSDICIAWCPVARLNFLHPGSFLHMPTSARLLDEIWHAYVSNCLQMVQGLDGCKYLLAMHNM